MMIHALIGGILIGLAALLLLLTDGQVAGISGMLGASLKKTSLYDSWRLAFLLGLLVGGAVAHLLGLYSFEALANRSHGALVAAGLLVGFGTQLGSGCTSGHGVCGIGRFSFRSLAATLTFMLSGILTVYFIKHVWGGA